MIIVFYSVQIFHEAGVPINNYLAAVVMAGVRVLGNYTVTTKECNVDQYGIGNFCAMAYPIPLLYPLINLKLDAIQKLKSASEIPIED